LFKYVYYTIFNKDNNDESEPVDEFKEDEEGCFEQTQHMMEELKNLIIDNRNKNEDFLEDFGDYILNYIEKRSKLRKNQNSKMPSWYIKEDDVETNNKDIKTHIG